MGIFLLIGMGGFFGAVMRYALSTFVQDWSKTPQFPLGTLVVNLIGCLLIGALAQLAEARNIFTPESSSLVFLGFLGAFTTFSTFSSDSFNLISAGDTFLSQYRGKRHLWSWRRLAGAHHRHLSWQLKIFYGCRRHLTQTQISSCTSTPPSKNTHLRSGGESNMTSTCYR